MSFIHARGQRLPVSREGQFSWVPFTVHLTAALLGFSIRAQVDEMRSSKIQRTVRPSE